MHFEDFVILDHHTLTLTVQFPGKPPLVIQPHSSELSISHFSHGHGGQNLNKHQNGVRLIYTIPESHRRADQPEHTLEVRCHEQRHQHQNMELAFKHLAEKLHEYFYVVPSRIKTQVPPHAQHERLESKRRRSKKKTLRQPPELDDNHLT